MFSSERGSNVARSSLRDGRRTEGGQSFRPVALPALAAAVHVASTAKAQAASRSSQTRVFVHEDEPQD